MSPPPAANGQQSNPTAQMIQMLVMFAIMGVMFYFVLLRPQQKKAKEHALLLKSLKAGDKVVSSSGIVGVVVSVKEKTVAIRSADTKLEILKSAVTEISESSANSSES